MPHTTRAPFTARARAILHDRWPWILIGAAIVALLTVVLVYLLTAGDDERPPMRFGAVAPHGDAFSAALYQSVGTSMQPGHRVEVLENGEVFGVLAREIASAKTSIHALQYIWEEGAASDRIVEAIEARAQAGVECRIVVDAFGSSDFEEHLGPRLRAAGCEVLLFRPDVELARNHRKIFVIDGCVAYTGGFGVRDEWLGSGREEDEWRDTNVRFFGPAVGQAQQTFAESWLEAGGTVLPPHAFPDRPRDRDTGPARVAFVASSGAPVLTDAERVVQLVIHSAERRVWIANAYFVPTSAITQLLVEKAEAGVDVRVLTAGRKSDSKTSWGAQHAKYDDLIDHGVRVWEYEPTMMHGKTIVVDDALSLIGTINLEPLSLSELDEDALVIDDRATAEHLARAFAADCELAEEQ
jgi:cardiolipin synthase